MQEDLYPPMSEFSKYDHLSLETALDRAWDDPDLSEAERRKIRARVRAQAPALARVLDRYVASRRGLDR